MEPDQFSTEQWVEMLQEARKFCQDTKALVGILKVFHPYCSVPDDELVRLLGK